MKNTSLKTTGSKPPVIPKVPLHSQRLRQIRIEKGLTLEEVSNLVSINKMTLQRYESGDIRSIAPERLDRLAKLYETTPGWLHGLDPHTEFYDDETGFYITPTKADPATATGKRLLECLKFLEQNHPHKNSRSES